jgi:hypothetical protein
VEQTVLKAVELGGLCIIPHPMTRGRIGVNPHTICRALRNPEVAAGLVGVEIFNAGLAGAQRDQQAVNRCRKMPLAQVGSSDAHVSWMIGTGATCFPGSSAEELRAALVNRQTQPTATYQMNWGDFFIRYLPHLMLRYAGWVTSNAGPSKPLQLSRSPGRTHRPAQPPSRRPLRPSL